MVDWSAVNGMDAEAGAKELSGLTAQMAQRLEKTPETASLLRSLLARHLEGAITPDSYSPVWEGVATLFGLDDDAPRLFAWLSQENQRERVDALIAASPPSVADMLRESIASYGQDLQQAYRRWREIPENWELLHRENYFDIDRGIHRVDLTILKYSGETVNFSLDARSLLVMVGRLMNSLSLVADETFTDQDLEDLRRESDAFWEAVAAIRDQATDRAEASPAA
ncbi:MAG: hypothetical protein ACTHKT_05070 [Solirubrobacterales bacterium]